MLYEKGSIRMGYKSPGGRRQGGGMRFEGKVNWPDAHRGESIAWEKWGWLEVVYRKQQELRIMW
jgi:hypothetical protein